MIAGVPPLVVLIVRRLPADPASVNVSAVMVVDVNN